MAKSLAEHLGVTDPAQPDAPAPTVDPTARMTAKQFALGILHTPQYRESLLRRILLHELPPAVECRLYDYAYGKPVERVEVKDTTDPIDALTVPQLEERALKLLEAARRLRDEQPSDETTEEGDTTVKPEAVH